MNEQFHHHLLKKHFQSTKVNGLIKFLLRYPTKRGPPADQLKMYYCTASQFCAGLMFADCEI